MTRLTPKYPRILRDRDNYRRWYLDQPIIVELNNGDKLNIPKGYRFDAHSVPFIFTLFFKKTYNVGIDGIQGKNDIYCSMIHDFLIDTEMFLRYTRKDQDSVYRSLMLCPVYSVSKWRSIFMPLAVSTYGYLRYTLWGDYRGEPKEDVYIRIETNESGN